MFTDSMQNNLDFLGLVILNYNNISETISCLESVSNGLNEPFQ